MRAAASPVSNPGITGKKNRGSGEVHGFAGAPGCFQARLRASLPGLSFVHLLRQVIPRSDFLDHVELSFQEIHMFLFVLKDFLKELA